MSSEFKGTPGPWVVGGNEGNKLSVNADQYFVALVDEGASQEANARLIAASPELLKALTTTLDEIGNWLSQQKPGLKEKIDSAIAKALGESQ